ncbi:MAG: CDP-glycerol glycerophosphotransferase family protein [Treponema sp.]|uniref:CDP-glycerol glycerophosphotransferase family protein n=1 Tax=Treponema sp. TaxID=166 RepID=UPI00298E5EC2|nr:CDP-glycerol glycerophosphotransferase family protein [Treponema sp.]MCQ2601575.1 CDP-glycerol glycerophosphotransferase family protein [Treponema sp.]
MDFFLYIDPGTGSMLFSILVGAAATLFFLGKAAWLKIKIFFSGKKDGLVVDSSYRKYVIYCEDKRYWNTFKPILDEAEKRKTEVTYFVATDKDPVFEQDYKFIKIEVIGEGNAAFAKLNMLSAGVVLMTTLGLQVYQLKRSKNVKHYAHILHAASDATMYRLFGIDYFDSVLLSGDYQKADIRTLEFQRNLPEKELVTVGCPYLDVLDSKISSLSSEENHSFTVLVSPSWGKDALLSRYGEKLLDPLVDSGMRVIVRPHPQSKISESEVLSKLEKRYENEPNVEWDYNGDNIIAMKKSDIMISDFSGIIYDYTFLFDKPVMYVNSGLDLRPYDAYDLSEKENGKNIWQFQALRSFGIELKEEQFSGLAEIIRSASDSKELADARKKAKNEAWMNRGKAGKAVVDFMISKVE